MKQKILVTIGDSYTEGVGCYNLHETSWFLDTNKRMPTNRLIEFEQKYSHVFHEQGWPNRVGKKLGFDKVYNIGKGGRSNSSCVKSFYNFTEKNNLSNSDVLVIWMMTDPARISFYINGKLKDYSYYKGFDSPLGNAYVKELVDIETDPILEQIFYIKTLKNLCELNNFDLIITSWNNTYPKLFELYPDTTHLFNVPLCLRPPVLISDNERYTYYSFCSHPNELGYDWIANKIVSGIKDNHSKWYNEESKQEIEWEWDSYDSQTKRMI